MRRPIGWLHWLLAFCLLLITFQGIVLAWLAPQYVIRVVESAVGGKLRIRDAQLAFPLTTTLLGVRDVNSSRESSFSIQKIVITPRWVSVPSKTIWLDRVRIEQPLFRISRSGAGSMAWPALPTDAVTDRRPSNWRLHINSLEIVAG